jgi:hypothetical protein
MRLDSFRSGVVSCFAGLAACATAPPTGAPKLAEPASLLSGESVAAGSSTGGAVKAAAPAAGPVAPLVAAVTVSDSGAAASALASAPQVNPRYLAKGYRVRLRGKVVLYCRSEAPTASNIRTETCRTGEQLEREAATTRAIIETMQEQRNRPPPPPPRRN